MTTLSDFIRTHIDPILEAQDKYEDNTQLPRPPPATHNQARDILLAIAAAMDDDPDPPPQGGPDQEIPKADSDVISHDTASLLAEYGVGGVMAELSALRAGVLRLWKGANADASQVNSSELSRFNEAVDRVLVEAIERHLASKNHVSRLIDTLMAATPDIYCLLDLYGKIISANTALAGLYGRKPTEVTGLNIVDLLNSNKDKLQTHLDEAAKSGKAVHGELPFDLYTGKQVTFEYSLIPVADASGTTDAIAVTARDITPRKQLEDELRKEMSLAEAIIESAPGPFFLIDERNNLVRWSMELRNVTGATDEQLRGNSILAYIDERDRPLAAAKFMAAFAIGFTSMEVRMPTRLGTRYFLKTARRFMVDGAPYVAGFCVDVTDRKVAEQSLEKEISFSNALIEGVPGAFYVVDMERNFFRWNSFLNRLTGLSDSQLKQQPALLTIHEDDRPLAAETMKRAFENGYAQAELRVLTHERGVRPFLMTARPFQVDGQKFLVGIGTDTTDWLAKIKALEHEAWTDPLTNVVNRGHFMELAKLEFARCRRYGHPLSLWMLDIDHFKAVNDTYGHQAGDTTLQSLVTASRQVLRDWDILGRMGGEEFAVLLPETETNQALLVAERLRQRVGTTVIPLKEGKTARVTVSIGIATVHEDDADVERLLNRADVALYEAKNTGRDKVCLADDLPAMLATVTNADKIGPSQAANL